VSSMRLLELYSVEYPCGWTVVSDVRSGPTDEKPGLIVTIALLSSTPVSLSPRSGSLADVELARWTDDPSSDGDPLGPLTDWVGDERARFQRLKETHFEGGSRTSVYLFDGALTGEEQMVAAYTALWEFTDAAGIRHVMRAVAVNPSLAARAAVERLARSFTVFQR
jgi:hypothetical protein